MLGHDASFCHILAVNCTRSTNLSLKKLGYQCCTLFLNEDSEFLILLIANFQKDLTGGIHEIVIALTALAKLLNSTMVNALYNTVQGLLTHQTDLVRKKAIMVYQRIYQLNPGMVTDYDEKMRRALCDKEPSVMGASLNLYYERCVNNPTPYKDQTSSFVIILKQVIEHKLPREFDYHRMPAPWIQIKILQILAQLGANDLKTSEQMYEVLSMCLKRCDDTGINIGEAVTYQCVKTIASIYPDPTLLESASNSISKIFDRMKTSLYQTNNLKYMAINALIKIAEVESKYVVKHQKTIVEWLESNDETLKREILKLLCKITNNTNVQAIVDKLIFYMKAASDPHYKKELVTNICQLSEQFAPNQEWFLKTMILVFEFGGEFIDNALLNNFLKLLSEHYQAEGSDFGGYLIQNFLEILQKQQNYGDQMYRMISWVLGEIGAQQYSNDPDQIREICEQLLTIITNEFEEAGTRSWILSALAKLSSTPSFDMGEELQACLEYYQSSKNIDIHQRSQDFIKLRKYNAALRSSSMVNLDENLSFLDGFVKNALLSGAQSYDPQKSIQAAMGVQNNSAQIYFEAKVPDKLYTKHNADMESQVKTTSSLWSKEHGYQGKLPENKVSETVLNKPTQPTAIQKTFEGTKSISSKEFEGQGRPSNPNQGNIGGLQYQSKQPQKEDPKEAEQNKLASQLFGGVENNASVNNKNVFESYNKQIQQQKNQQQQKTVQQQNQSNNNNSNNQDLIDLLGEDITNSSVNNQSQNNRQGPPVFGNRAKGPPVFGSKSQGPPVFGAAKQKQPQQKQQQQYQQQFEKLNIGIEQYEQLWENLSQEIETSIQSKINNEQSLRECWEKLGINIIDISDNELICGGISRDQKQNLLVYSVYNANGELNLTLKSNNMTDINKVISFIKQFYV
ncbi:Armadillo-type fold [Pseudocohnilembus persalinus]|uniref:AP-2 complex subunit alpha n=1 Tax=Pseudocohnilembus persalinus TaxID=266149 RepID=A0A0V0QJU3_PSEPJ|nr:Armadillo-type fold [Pseudocohnilembus persalinus]|eukprot:KRX02553.1 Armadillo-type fold [Pseudocohnilembus persalinus]